jgi:hypothetical protein
MLERTLGIFATKAENFHLKEYVRLRDEIDHISRENRNLERNVVIAMGVTWGWLYGQGAHGPVWAYFIPLMFAVLGAIRAHGIDQSFGALGGYITNIEDAFHKEGSPIGWEHHLKKFYLNGTPDSKGQLLFWIILHLSALVVAGLRIAGLLK